jgi:hypothetical protein
MTIKKQHLKKLLIYEKKLGQQKKNILELSFYYLKIKITKKKIMPIPVLRIRLQE